jgi:hypothetical protein
MRVVTVTVTCTVIQPFIGRYLVGRRQGIRRPGLVEVMLSRDNVYDLCRRLTVKPTNEMGQP